MGDKLPEYGKTAREVLSGGWVEPGAGVWQERVDGSRDHGRVTRVYMDSSDGKPIEYAAIDWTLPDGTTRSDRTRSWLLHRLDDPGAERWAQWHGMSHDSDYSFDLSRFKGSSEQGLARDEEAARARLERLGQEHPARPHAQAQLDAITAERRKREASTPKPPAQLSNEEIAQELADLEPRLGEEEDDTRAARATALLAEQDNRRKAAAGAAPSGPGGTWADMQREEADGEDRGLFGADALLAAQPQDQVADEFGTPDLFADAEGRESRLRADRLKPGDRYITDDGSVAEVDTAETVGRGSVKVRTRDGRTLYHRTDHRFRRAQDDDDQAEAGRSRDDSELPAERTDRSDEADGRQDDEQRDDERDQPDGEQRDDEADGRGRDDEREKEEEEEKRRRRRRRRDRDGVNLEGPDGPGLPLAGIPLPDGMELPVALPSDPDSGLVDVPRSPIPSGGGDRVEALRKRYRSRKPLPGLLDDPRHRKFLRELAKNPTLTTSTGGNLVLWSEDGGEHWRIAQADMGVAMADPLISEVAGTVEDARRIADQYEAAIKDANGRPFPWSDPDPLATIRTWEDSEGRGLAEAMRAIRDADRPGSEPAALGDLSALPDGELEAALQRALADDPATVDQIMREMDRRDDIEAKLRAAGLTDTPPATDADRAAEQRVMDAAFGLPRPESDDAAGTGLDNVADRDAVRPALRRAVTLAEQDTESYEQWVEAVLADLHGRAYGDAAGSGDPDLALRGGTGVTREGEALGITAEMIVRNNAYGRTVGDLGRFANDDLQPLMARHGFPLSLTTWIKQRQADRARDRDLNRPEEPTPAATDRVNASNEAADVSSPASADEVVPAGNTPSGRRFQTVDDVREHFTAAADQLFAESGYPEGERPGEGHTEEQWNAWHRAALLRSISTDPELALSDGGGLAYVGHREANGRTQWRVYFTGSGETSLNPYTRATSKEKARAVANAFEAIRDEHGQPVPWDDPSFTGEESTWRDADGRTLSQAMLHAHASLPGVASQSLREQDRMATNTVTAARHWQDEVSTEGFTHSLRHPDPDLRPGDVVRFEVQFWRNEPNQGSGHHQYQYETDAEWQPRSLEPGGPYDDNYPRVDMTQFVEITGRVGEDGQLSEAVFRRLGDGVTGPVRNPRFPDNLSDRDSVYAARRPRRDEPGYDPDYQLPTFISDLAQEDVQTPPAPIGGRPAEWARAVDLLPGDVAHVEGTDRRGRAVTRSGFVLAAPEFVTVTRDGRRVKALRLAIGESPSGTEGKRHLVVVTRDAQVARAAHADDAVPEGAPLTGAQVEALTGRLDGQYPTDNDGSALFPGGIVADGSGNEGLITGVTSLTASVRWSGDREEEVVSPSTVRVTDAGAARPSGWTLDGRRVEPGQVAVDRESGRPLGVVDGVDGDSVSLMTPEGPTERDAPSLRVAERQGGTRGGAAAVELQGVTAEDLKDGDVVLLDDGGRPTLIRVTSAERDGDRVAVEYEEVDGGAPGMVEMDRAMVLERPSTAVGDASEFSARDARTSIDETRVEAPPVALEPISGDQVDPQLSPAERDRIGDLALGAADEPEAEQGAARLTAGMPVSEDQAAAVADVLDAHAGTDADGRVAGRAARHLREATGQESTSTAPERPVPGTASELAPGDVVALPDGDDAEVVTVTDVRPGPVGTQVVTTEDAAGEQTSHVLPSGAGVWQLPDPANMRRVILPSLPAEAVTPDSVPAGNRSGSAPSAGSVPAHDTDQAQAGTALVAAHAWGIVNAVIETAVEGAEPGTIHALRQAVAERLTPEATRNAERRAAYAAAQALDAAGLPDAERHQVEQAGKAAAKKAREAAVRAALRTLNDLEALDGETEEDTAKRAAALLRRIPDVLDVDKIARTAISRPYASPRASTPSTGAGAGAGRGTAPAGRRPSIVLPRIGRVRRRADRAVASHVDTSIAEALRHAEEAVAAGSLTADRADEIVSEALAALASNREAVAQEIIDAITSETGVDPTAGRPGLFARIMAALVRIAKRVAEILKAMLRKLKEVWAERDERLRRFRERLVRRIRLWPESQQLREEAAAAVEGPGEGANAVARFEHWATLIPEPGRFGQEQRQVRAWRRARVRDLEAGRLPEMAEGTQWVRDRSVDGGPGPAAMRHLAAVRGAGEALDSDVSARIAQAAPELGVDPRATVTAARAYEQSAGRRADRVIAAARAGDADAAVEEAGARMEAQQARLEARRVEASYAAALADAAAQALSQIRPMGSQPGAALEIHGRGAGADALRLAERFFPADWLAAAGPVAGAVGNRESYDPGTGRVVVTADPDADPIGVALHGLAHHLQRAVPEVAAAEEAYHFVRTSTGRIGARQRTPQTRLARRFPAAGHSPAATARPGGWEHLFTGAEPADGRSWEILPTGLEGLFSGSWYLDDDLRQFLLGMLGTLGRRRP
ncbi:hypothetical protein [Kitasatospora sp. NPDC088548]|uniref:hypothetical protein n=1 Tax=Kitasatospora sp. NPDC088548 TaxID=3364075 RepID=UPI00380559F7